MSYKRSKYFTTSSKKKIKYLHIKKKSNITVVFFHGFMSNMTGAKPVAISKFCRKQKINFLKFEYSGHGKSSGKFIEGNITKWTNESKELLKSKIKKNNKLIFIGSSMGSWIALNLYFKFRKQIKGFIGIASAPEFLQKLMWNKFTNKIKNTILKKKIYNLDLGNYTYPITKQLIFNGKKNKIFNKKIKDKIFVTLLHGQKDDVVPFMFSKKISKIFTRATKNIIKIKNGDHSLSRNNDLKKICKELKKIIVEI